MRITGVTLFKADIPLKDPFRIAVMEMRSAMNVFVRIDTDAGLVGWGEASPCWKLCGETQESCRFAEATVSGGDVILAGDGRPKSRVRYAWADSPTVNTYAARAISLPGFEIAIEP